MMSTSTLLFLIIGGQFLLSVHGLSLRLKGRVRIPIPHNGSGEVDITDLPIGGCRRYDTVECLSDVSYRGRLPNAYWEYTDPFTNETYRVPSIRCKEDECKNHTIGWQSSMGIYRKDGKYNGVVRLGRRQQYPAEGIFTCFFEEERVSVELCDTIGTGDVEIPQLHNETNDTHINVFWNKPEDIDGFTLIICDFAGNDCDATNFSSYTTWHAIENGRYVNGIIIAYISALRYSCGGIIDESDNYTKIIDSNVHTITSIDEPTNTSAVQSVLPTTQHVHTISPSTADTIITSSLPPTSLPTPMPSIPLIPTPSPSVCVPNGDGVEPPTNVTTNDLNATHINISWDKASEDVDGFSFTYEDRDGDSNSIIILSNWRVIEKRNTTITVTSLRFLTSCPVEEVIVDCSPKVTEINKTREESETNFIISWHAPCDVDHYTLYYVERAGPTKFDFSGDVTPPLTVPNGISEIQLGAHRNNMTECSPVYDISACEDSGRDTCELIPKEEFINGCVSTEKNTYI